jgi:Mg-chelatase subunit ChlD
MSTNLRLPNRSHATNRRGAMLVLIAVMFVFLFIAAAFAVDVARIHVTRSELRTATDAAAKAAVEALGREQSIEAGRNAAIEVARRNIVAGNGLDLRPSDIVFGGSVAQDDGSFAFDPNASFINSARVTGSRTEESLDGSVGLFFAPLVGAGNFEPQRVASAARTDRDIALVLDVSGSMASGGRFEALSNGLNVFLNELEATRQREAVSLTVYSTEARKLQDMTDNLNLIRSAFADESPAGFTAIGRGMRVGLNSILSDAQSRPFALKSLIVMTDGNQNRGVNPRAIARRCAAENVTVHTITFSDGANQALMRQVANVGNGNHLHAVNNGQLVEAFREIARQLQVLLIE